MIQCHPEANLKYVFTSNHYREGLRWESLSVLIMMNTLNELVSRLVWATSSQGDEVLLKSYGGSSSHGINDTTNTIKRL